MDKISVECLIKNSIVDHCKSFVGNGIKFEVDGIICVSRHSPSVDIVFKIHELIPAEEINELDTIDNGLNFSIEDIDSMKIIKQKHTNVCKNTINQGKNNFSISDHSSDNINLNKKLKLEQVLENSDISYNENAFTFKCGICLNYTKFESKVILEDHLIDSHFCSSKVILCEINNCNIGFASKIDYLNHYESNHNLNKNIEEEIKVNDNINPEKSFEENSVQNDNSLISLRNSSKNFLKLNNNSRHSSSILEKLKIDSTIELNVNDLKKELNSSNLNGESSQNEPRQCQICHEDFVDFPSFNVHSSQMHNLHSCPDCDQTFELVNERDAHLFEHTGEEPLLFCFDCNLSFSRPDSMERHQQRHHKQVSFSYNQNINDNFSKFSTQSQKDSIKKRVFSAKQNRELSLDSSDYKDSFLFENGIEANEKRFSPYKINLSKRKLWTKGDALNLDEDYISSNNSYQDQITNGMIELNSEDEDSLQNLSSIHPFSVNTGRGKKPWFKYITTLDMDRSFSCELCSESINGVEPYKIHCNEVHGRIPCPYCGCTYSQKASMERHMRQHTGERPYVCNMCPRSYTRKENLQMHVYRFHNVTS